MSRRASDGGIRLGIDQRRGQANVVGVALLLAITVIALGMLTAGIGAVTAQNAAAANAGRVEASFVRTLDPVETTGARRGRLRFTDGTLHTESRDLRVLDENGVVDSVDVDALVYESGDRRVAFLAGAVVRGRGEAARIVRPPPLLASHGDGGVLVVGAPRLGATADGVDYGGHADLVLETYVSHTRRDLGNGTYRIAIETTTPAAWSAYFEDRGATVVSTTRDFDGDGVPSVVAAFPGERRAYLVVHEMRLEVHDA